MGRQRAVDDGKADGSEQLGRSTTIAGDGTGSESCGQDGRRPVKWMMETVLVIISVP